MPRRPIHSTPAAQPGDRLFNDAAGRLWCAARERAVRSSDAVVFTCLSDARQKSRALAAAGDLELSEARDDLLRTLLVQAPRLGRLT
ncbi:MAG: hypothetical protein H7Z74_17045 [Anaerolineae bacterium]|nr:hypothetical protein [Gemmatimonadaceae bacterium]